MCGISGVVAPPPELIPVELLERMASRMENRGPDAGGTFASANAGLAHRRLKIIDLSDEANQPMRSEDDRLAIVFNGEIYNFRQIRADLEDRGHRFRTRSDTEVILRAFEEWGTASFRKLNGIFAFGILDLRSDAPVLHLVRDRFGVKPLFYATQDGHLAFASELKPLFDLPWLRLRVDRRTLFQYLKFSHVPTPYSIFENVRQVRPGTWITLQAAQLSEHRYWDPSELSRVAPDEGRGEDGWLEELEEILKRVVDRQLVSDVPVGCLLSGGIDSSLLVMAVASLDRPPLRTFSIGYREARFDETPHARAVAEAFGTDHHELIVGPEDLLELIPKMPLYYDQPFADPTLLPTLRLAQFAREKVTVALSGDGGDEMFFGYTHQQVLKLLRPVLSIPLGMRRGTFGAVDWLLGHLPRHGWADRRQQARKAAQILQFDGEAELLSYFVGTLGPMRLDRLAGLLAEPPDRSRPLFADMLLDLEGLPWHEKISQVFVRTFLPDTVLAKTDRAAMAFGLEGRVPFLDNEMAEFSARVPFRLKLLRGTKKYLLRRLLARKLPGAISGRRKQGFSIPLRDWLRGRLRYLLSDCLDESRLKSEGFFEATAVRTLVDEHLSGAYNHSHVLWSLICFQMWREHYSVR